MEQVKSLDVSGDTITATIGLTAHSAILWNQTRGRVEELLRARFPQAADVRVSIVPHHRPPMKVGQLGIEAKSA